MGIDITNLVNKSKSKIHCIYGDRGINNSESVLKELELPLEIQEKLSIEIVENACHFPMIENRDKVSNCLKRWVE